MPENVNLATRSYKKELLDDPSIPFEDIRVNMRELNTINTLLGGHNITIEGLKLLLKNQKKITVCEIGCGDGNNLFNLSKWCKKNNVELNCIGIDLKKECIDAAKTTYHFNNVEWILNDYKNAVFKTKPDIIFSSLFCHHFTDEELASQLQWMQKNCTIGFFINDLQRNWFAYYSIKLITSIFSSSYLVKNDAPLSVARGFHKKEWQKIFKEASVKNYVIQWKWAFRYLIIYNHANTI